MSVTIYDLEGKPQSNIDLPEVFKTPFRPDIIRKSVLFQQSHRRQTQGRDPMAGKRTSARSMGTGHGLSRVPRVKGSRYPRAQQAAFAPSAVGGRATHPPKAEKRIYKRINEKERELALCSAIAATADKQIVASRGHVVEKVPQLPLVVVDAIEGLTKTTDVKNVFEKLGLMEDVKRVLRSWKARSGKAALRGRPSKHGVGPLLVVSKDQGVGRAARNLLGVDVVELKSLNTELLAPGTHPGRLTVWASSAIQEMHELIC
ncbi:MAG: 50S ribosomal protein L4 [Candidatus Bathyarchaeia archaeon]